MQLPKSPTAHLVTLLYTVLGEPELQSNVLIIYEGDRETAKAMVKAILKPNEVVAEISPVAAGHPALCNMAPGEIMPVP